ncbi:TMEM175 family protein [Diaminobutyricibacter sp. McL0608]|uniref:TMEM175 family protein n=1 Tax=Leifsonia sp. McL0608 TaxID=3143537 RepID=UPI0031F31AD8
MASFRTDRGLDRLVNFSDAAVAIAITLLVLPLVDIAAQISKTHPTVWGLFLAHWPTFLAFAVSFVVIARFWVVHHRVFEFVRDYNPTLVRLNFLWLASIVFLPFATNVLALASGTNPGVNALYIGTLIVTSASMLLIEFVLTRNPGLLREGVDGGLRLTSSAVATALFVVALVLAVLVPKVGMLWLLLLLLSRPIEALYDRWTHRDRSAPTT